ncbi:MAG: GWxTD domain-containing protein [bacterium]
MSLSRAAASLLIVSSLFCQPQSLAAAGLEDAYNKGLALKKDGRYEQALKTWWQARTALEMQGTSDPRIGIAFIELATEQKLEKYYGTASDMYLWGFSRASVREFKKEIEAEVARILPLLEDEVQKKWQALVEQGSNKILPKIRQFWIEKDAMPTTPGNERLIEHWQRIAYARKNFIKNRLSVYGCDDRGLIYVKYGEPDNSIQRIVGSNLNEAMVWKELFTIPPGAKFNVMSVAMHQQPLFAGRIRDAIGFGECEVWAYGSINADGRVLFVFGNREGTGAYRLFDSIEDLINPRFFRGSGSMFGALLQLIYYNELAVFDSAFMKRYSELETRFSEAYSNAVRNNTTRFLARAFGSSFKAMHKKYQVSDKYDPLKKYADKNRSELDDLGNKIRLNTSMTRILDLQNQPTLVFIAFAIPSISNDLQNLENASYNLRYTLLIRDSSFAQIDRHATRQAPIPLHTHSRGDFR